MARLKDVQYSQRGEQPIEQMKAEIEMSELALQDAPKVERQFIIFKLVDTKKRGGVHIPNVDDVYNPETKKVERVRLLSGVDSIWAKDQKGIDADYIRQNSRSITFPRGSRILRVPTWDTQLLEFLRVCRHNIDNPNRKTGSHFEFFEYDPEKQQRAALEKEMLEIEMAIEASKQPEDKMRKHAAFLGIAPIDEFGVPKSVEGIRRDYVLAAKRNPKKFKESLNSKEVEINYLVRRAVNDAKIDLGNPNGNISWSGGGVICKLPPNRKPIEYLVELALTNSADGSKFLAQLQSLVS